jgi:hypothetical protein
LLFLFPGTLIAQEGPVLKGYGFQLPSVETKSSVGYTLYAEYKRNKCLKITSVWIGTGYYEFTTKKRIKTPLLEGTKEMIPATKNKVLQIILVKKQSPSPRPGSELISYLKDNKAVIAYRHKKKQYFIGIPQLEQLKGE